VGHERIEDEQMKLAGNNLAEVWQARCGRFDVGQTRLTR
jgi:hypothetical protein